MSRKNVISDDLLDVVVGGTLPQDWRQRLDKDIELAEKKGLAWQEIAKSVEDTLAACKLTPDTSALFKEEVENRIRPKKNII